MDRAAGEERAGTVVVDDQVDDVGPGVCAPPVLGHVLPQRGRDIAAGSGGPR
ncbi:hypothetical protein ACFY0G_20985 [Streptomyces sp. NPDC001552]|uniref:hypothetical protein n=1 Tax=Streptomyces sp. NPDC001552 TaxID=3364587 RepID=UPI0036B11743